MLYRDLDGTASKATLQRVREIHYRNSPISSSTEAES